MHICHRWVCIMETKPKCQHDFVHMGLCVVGMGRELAPMSCSLAPDPTLFAFALHSVHYWGSAVRVLFSMVQIHLWRACIFNPNPIGLFEGLESMGGISATQEPIDLKLGTDIKQVEKNKNQKEKWKSDNYFFFYN